MLDSNLRLRFMYGDLEREQLRLENLQADRLILAEKIVKQKAKLKALVKKIGKYDSLAGASGGSTLCEDRELSKEVKEQ